MTSSAYTPNLFQHLNKQNIRYCVLEINTENRMLDLFIHTDDLSRFQVLLSSLNYKKTGSTTETHRFIYGLIPDAFWENNGGEQIHSSCQMFCSSLSNLIKAKLPLDRSIQTSLWENKVWNEIKQCWEISREDYIIYLLINCIFNQKAFDDTSKRQLASLSELLNHPTLAEKLTGVFFKFTSTLIDLVKEQDFDSIIKKYMTFCEY